MLRLSVSHTAALYNSGDSAVEQLRHSHVFDSAAETPSHRFVSVALQAHDRSAMRHRVAVMLQSAQCARIMSVGSARWKTETPGLRPDASAA